MSVSAATRAPGVIPQDAPAPIPRRLLYLGLLLAGGGIFNLIAYGTPLTLAAASIYYALGIVLLWAFRADLREGRLFRTCFAVGFFWSGVSGIFAEVLQDGSQLYNDAGNFYKLSSGISQGLSLEQIQSFTEGAGAIVVWRAIYNAFALVGFEKARYIGVFVNIIFVALTGVVTLKIARQIRSEDEGFLDRVAAYFPWLGTFWLFSSQHLRDAVILLGITGLMWCWAKWLAFSSSRNFLLLVPATLAGFAYFGTLRTEFVFVPAAMLAAGLAAKAVFAGGRGGHTAALGILAGTLVCVGLGVVVALKTDLISELSRAYEDYSALSGSNDAASASLGNALIVNAPIPVRIVFGTLYLFIFPIPFWHGFQLDTAAHLYKSLNVLFYYATLPLFAICLYRLKSTKAARTPPVMFIAFVLSGFTFAICMTSLETRHFGAFQAAYVLLAAMPDTADPAVRVRYRSWSSLFLGAIAAMHLAWLVVKGAA